MSSPSRRFSGRGRGRLAALAAAFVAAVLPVAGPAAPTPAQAAERSPSAAGGTAGPAGYWMVASDGGVFAQGTARFLGSTGGIHLNQPITGMAPTPTGQGYWLTASDGGIFAFGDAGFYGSTGAIKLNRPITGMAATRTGRGYWLVASDGGIFAFGDAKFFGSTGGISLNRPITGMAPTPTGNGYWLTASDGGIFAFGDARFFGSTGAMHLNQPIAAMAPSPSGGGYWLAASDGGIFTFGDAGFYGAAPSRPATAGPRTVVAMVPTATGAGYWQASSTGELLAFGDAPDLGGASGLSHPIVALAAVPGSGLPPVDDSATAGDTGGHGAAPATPTPTTTSRPGSPATTTTTASPAGATSTSTTTTTVPYTPPTGGPRAFSSTARVTWGTPLDPNRSGYAQAVDAMVEVGDTVFVAGEFTNVAAPNGSPATPPQPFLVALDVNTGAPVAGSRFNASANPDGPIFALAASPDGHRLYVGGKFTTVGGKAIRRLAALDVDTGLWDPTFKPPTPSAYINAVTVAQGRLYIGGAFSSLTPSATGAPVARPQLAALDAASGALIDGFVPPTNYGGVFETHTGKPVEDQPGSYNPGVVDAIAVTADGGTVMVGGNFLHFGTAPADDPDHQHGGLVALDGTTGALSLWQPVSKRPVFGLTVWPGDGNTVFTAAGGAGGVVQAFRPGFSTSPKWTGHVDGDARGVAATTDRVYLVGHYDHEVPNAKDPCLQLTPQPPDGHLGISCPNGDPHRHLAAFDAKTGNVDPTFTAQADTNEGPSVAYIGAKNLYIGGNFLDVSDSPTGVYRSQPGLAVYPATS